MDSPVDEELHPVLVFMPKRRKAAKTRKGRRSGGDASLVKLAARLAPYALSAFKGAVAFFNPEVKHVDVSDDTATSTTPNVVLLSGIAEGDTNSARDGTSVKVVSLYGDLAAIVNTSATNSFVRVLIFADRENQGAAPTAADIVDTGSSAIGLPNIDSRPGRFAILLDKVITLVAGAADAARHHSRFDLRAVLDTHLLFSGTGATAASIQGLSYWFVAFSTEATNTPTVRLRSRLSYIDN